MALTGDVDVVEKESGISMADRTVFRMGSTEITKVHEVNLDGFKLRELLPALDEQVLAHHPEWIPPNTTDETGHAFMSVHSWLLRHDGRNILIDTGIGNDKSRPQQAVFNKLNTPYVERLAAAGVRPEEIDLVLLTHVHSDHVGWNTRLVSGAWTPTFPNAEIVCSNLEWRYGAALTDGDEAEIARCREEAGMGEPVRIPVSGTFADSMRPLQGRAPIRREALDGAEIVPGIRFLPTPGHSIDHASIELNCDGERALFSGDVFHHPVEIYAADLVSVFCEFPDMSRRSRARFLKHASSHGAMVFTSHFPLSSAGVIEREDDRYRWRFVDGASAS